MSLNDWNGVFSIFFEDSTKYRRNTTALVVLLITMEVFTLKLMRTFGRALLTSIHSKDLTAIVIMGLEKGPGFE